MGFTVHWLNPTTLERNSKALACRRMLGRQLQNLLIKYSLNLTYKVKPH